MWRFARKAGFLTSSLSSLKIANFSPPTPIYAPAEELPLELGNTGWVQETRMMGPSSRERV